MKLVKRCMIMMFTLALVVTGMTFAASKVTVAEATDAAAAPSECKVVPGNEVTETDGIPVLAGYVFAGWYQDAEATVPYRTALTDTTSAYAKFVPADVLTVKAQLSISTDEKTKTETAALRFVTTVDTLKYDQVGFKITINGVTQERESKTVYTELLVMGSEGSTYPISPSSFSPASNYFCALTLTGIPSSEWNTPITIAPFWKTLDGATVYGIQRTITVADGKTRCVARIGDSYYGTVADAVQAAVDGNVVEVLSDVIIDTTINVDKQITITNEAGKTVTLTRANNLIDAVFTVAKTGNLAIQCAETGTVTVDGAQVEATNSMIVNEGTFTLGENAGLINGKVVDGSTNYGGALKNEKGAAAVFEGKVNNNIATSGGAVYNFGGTVTVNGGEFKGNSTMADPTVSTQGRAGAIYTHNNGTTIVKDGLFEKNQATGTAGGGAFGGTGYSTLEITGGTFRQNTASSTATNAYGGGAIESAGKVTITGGTFEANTALRGGAIYMDKGTNALLSISGGTFTGNRAEGNEAMGGVIYNAGDSFTITGGAFTENYAYYRGGVMYIANDNFEQIDISNANFTKNSVDGVAGKYHGGGVLYVKGTKVTGTEKKANRVKIENCIFDDNEATAVGNSNATGLGGVIYNTDSYSLNIGTSTFRNNSARLGGAIYIKSNMSLNSESVFENNTAYSCPDIYENQGTIYMNGKVVANIGLNGTSVIQENNVLKEGSDIKIRVINATSIKDDTGRVVVRYKDETTMEGNQSFFELDSNTMGAYELRFADNQATVYKK